MTGNEDPDDIEDRVDEIEDQVEEVDFESIRERIDAIERNQTALKNAIDRLAKQRRTENEQIPHIDSVEGLYDDLTAVEQQLARLRSELESVSDETESEPDN